MNIFFFFLYSVLRQNFMINVNFYNFKFDTKKWFFFFAIQIHNSHFYISGNCELIKKFYRLFFLFTNNNHILHFALLWLLLLCQIDWDVYFMLKFLIYKFTNVFSKLHNYTSLRRYKEYEEKLFRKNMLLQFW